MLASCRTDLRRCLWDLRNDALEEKTFDAALRKTLQPLLGDALLRIRFNVPRARIDDSTAHAVLSVVRELVSNAIRHGAAAKIRVAGDFTDGILRFSVADDGCGFDVDAASSVADGHFGLAGIRDRIAKTGGTFAVESTPGRGTRASVTIPVSRKEST